MPVRPFLAALLFLTFVAGPVDAGPADGCEVRQDPFTASVHGWYYLRHHVLDGTLVGVEMWYETNGVAGLQTAASSCEYSSILPGDTPGPSTSKLLA